MSDRGDHELWRTDGTDAGTTAIQRFAGGDQSSVGGDFRAAGAHVFFSASDGDDDTELSALPLAAFVRD